MAVMMTESNSTTSIAQTTSTIFSGANSSEDCALDRGVAVR